MKRHPVAVPQLHDFLIESARRFPDKVALVSRGERLTYTDIDERSNQLASALAASGIGRGQRVVVFLDNSVDAVVAFWGVLKANAVVSMVSSQVKADKLAQMIEDCAASALLTDARLARVARDAAPRCPSLAVVVVRRLADAPDLAALPAAVDWEAVTAAQPPSCCPPRQNLDIDLASIIYTSGSTGQPKGIMLTHRNMITAATSITTYLDNTEDDVILGALPLSFDYGLYQAIMAARMGARLVLERSFAYPADVLKTIVDEKVTGLPGVPTLFATMAEMKALEQFDLSGIKYVTNTAAALTMRHIEFLRRTFPQARIYSMYGLTECKRCTYLPPEDLDRKPLSVGIAIPNTELWLVDEEGNRLGPNQVGQLVIRGATVMKGYWGKPEATAKRLRPGPLPGEYVLYTGDYARLDEDGYLYFVGRMDEVIKSRGEKVAPEEVERALLAIPGVREAAVVGVPDDLLGHAVKAFVVPEAGATLDERTIKVECQRRLEPHMVPKYVAFVPDFPRTTTGKPDRRALGQRAREMAGQDQR